MAHPVWILFFSVLRFFPAHHFCCAAPPPCPPPSLSFPTTPDVSQSLKHLRVLTQVPFPCPIPLLRQLWMLPSPSMWNLSPGPFSFSSSSSKTAHFSLLPTSLIQMSCPCHTMSLGLSWELKSIFQLILGHSFCPYLSFHYSTLFPPPSLAFISPASLWPKKGHILPIQTSQRVSVRRRIWRCVSV